MFSSAIRCGCRRTASTSSSFATLRNCGPAASSAAPIVAAVPPAAAERNASGSWRRSSSSSSRPPRRDRNDPSATAAAVPFSTAAATSPRRDDELYVDAAGIRTAVKAAAVAAASSKQAQSKVRGGMPRLRALREQLRSEREGDAVVAFSPSPASSVGRSPARRDVDGEGTLEPVVLGAREDVDVEKYVRANGREVLTDLHGRHHNYLRISLAERCNLRCRYCMPPEGVPLRPSDEILTRSEIARLVRMFAGHGVDKVRLTGGEPLLRKDLVDIVGDISTTLGDGGMVGMTTNALTLGRQIGPLVDAGLTSVNISLDTLHEDKFVEITRRKGLHRVLTSIDGALDAFRGRYGSAREDGDGPGGYGTARVKINCVVMNNFNDGELHDFAELANGRFGGDVDVRFIEWMPFNDNGWNRSRFVAYKDMMEGISSAAAAQASAGGGGGSPPPELRKVGDGPNDTTKWWRLGDGRSRIGFITSMSNHFCGSCNRLRITANGNIKVCLFGSNEREVSLRDVLRRDHDGGEGKDEDDDEELGRIIHAAVQRKHFSLGGHKNPEAIAKASNNRPMTLIGG